MSVNECINYCKNNTKRSATEFTLFCDPRHREYMYWLPCNGNENYSQEIFVFRGKSLGPIDYLTFNRYNFVTSSTKKSSQDDDDGVGSIQLFLYDEETNKKENTYTIIFYGCTAETDIFYYEYEINNTYSKTEKYKGKVILSGAQNDAWMLIIHNLGNTDVNEKRELANIKFYDQEFNLVFENSYN